jgi:hypothetical protein
MAMTMDVRQTSTPALELSQSYRILFGWPTAVDDESGEVRLTVGVTVDTLIFPPGFAGEVNMMLKVRLQRVPIIVVPGHPAKWMFLTQPRSELRQSTYAELVRYRVEWLDKGSQITLPSSGPGGVRWLEGGPTVGCDLPLWTTIASAARSAAAMVAW